jgi:hypothetical protein
MSTDNYTPEELEQAKMLVSRVKFWTPDLEKLLRKWRVQIAKKQEGHMHAHRSNNKKYYILGVPTTILAAVIASGILATFQNCDPASNSCVIDQWLRLTIAILGVINVILTAFHIFMGYQAKAEQHKNAADSFDELTRSIDSTIQLPPSMRGDAIGTLQTLRIQYTDVVKTAPGISQKYDGELEYKTIEPLKPPPRPNVGDTEGGADTIVLAKMLLEDIQTKNANSLHMQKEVARANKNVRDDDSQKVTIHVDLDSARPNDSRLANKQKAIFSSLAKSLEFELARFHDNDDHIKSSNGKSRVQIDGSRRTSRKSTQYSEKDAQVGQDTHNSLSRGSQISKNGGAEDIDLEANVDPSEREDENQ